MRQPPPPGGGGSRRWRVDRGKTANRRASHRSVRGSRTPRAHRGIPAQLLTHHADVARINNDNRQTPTILPRKGEVAPQVTEGEEHAAAVSSTAPSVWQVPATSPWRGRIAKVASGPRRDAYVVRFTEVHPRKSNARITRGDPARRHCNTSLQPNPNDPPPQGGGGTEGDGGGGTRSSRFANRPLRLASASHLPLAGEDRNGDGCIAARRPYFVRFT